ncbi:hypothetical protein BU17DRAFT_62276 [Hysterangium stoloniferum]|nr:hypothetical protein BU17DRAFT_62276 [Hysterangium stoloniferum]
MDPVSMLDGIIEAVIQLLAQNLLTKMHTGRCSSETQLRCRVEGLSANRELGMELFDGDHLKLCWDCDSFLNSPWIQCRRVAIQLFGPRFIDKDAYRALFERRWKRSYDAESGDYQGACSSRRPANWLEPERGALFERRWKRSYDAESRDYQPVGNLQSNSSPWIQYGKRVAIQLFSPRFIDKDYRASLERRWKRSYDAESRDYDLDQQIGWSTNGSREVMTQYYGRRVAIQLFSPRFIDKDAYSVARVKMKMQVRCSVEGAAKGGTYFSQ